MTTIQTFMTMKNSKNIKTNKVFFVKDYSKVDSIVYFFLKNDNVKMIYLKI